MEVQPKFCRIISDELTHLRWNVEAENLHSLLVGLERMKQQIFDALLREVYKLNGSVTWYISVHIVTENLFPFNNTEDADVQNLPCAAVFHGTIRTVINMTPSEESFEQKWAYDEM